MLSKILTQLVRYLLSSKMTWSIHHIHDVHHNHYDWTTNQKITKVQLRRNSLKSHEEIKHCIPSIWDENNFCKTHWLRKDLRSTRCNMRPRVFSRIRQSFLQRFQKVKCLDGHFRYQKTDAPPKKREKFCYTKYCIVIFGSFNLVLQYTLCIPYIFFN